MHLKPENTLEDTRKNFELSVLLCSFFWDPERTGRPQWHCGTALSLESCVAGLVVTVCGPAAFSAILPVESRLCLSESRLICTECVFRAWAVCVDVAVGCDHACVES